MNDAIVEDTCGNCYEFRNVCHVTVVNGVLNVQYRRSKKGELSKGTKELVTRSFSLSVVHNYSLIEEETE